MTFRYAQGSDPLDWHFLCAVDPRRLFPEGKVDAPLLQRILETVAFGRVSRDDASTLSPDHVSHLFQLCQILIQYVTYSQEKLVVANSTLIARNKSLEADALTLKEKIRTLEADLASSHKEVKAQRRTLMAFEFEKAFKAPATGGPFKCSHCSESYHKEESLESHIRKRHTVVNVQPVAPPPPAAPAPLVLTHPEILQMQSQIADLRTQLQFERDRQLRMMQQPAQVGPTIAPDYASLMAAASRFAVVHPLQPASSTAPAEAHTNSEVLAQIERTLQKLVDRTLAPTATIVPEPTVTPLPPPTLPVSEPAAKPPPKLARKQPWLRLGAEANKDQDSIVQTVDTKKFGRLDSFESLATPPTAAGEGPLIAEEPKKPFETIKADSFTSTPVLSPPAMKEPAQPAEPAQPSNLTKTDSTLVKPVDSVQIKRGSMFGDLSVSSVPKNTASPLEIIAVPSLPAQITPNTEPPKADDKKLEESGSANPLAPISGGFNPLARPLDITPSPNDQKPLAPSNVRVLDESSILSHHTDNKSALIMPGISSLPQSTIITPATTEVAVVPSATVPIVSIPQNDLQLSMKTDVLGVSQQNTSLPLPASSLPPGFEFAPTSISAVPVTVLAIKPVEISKRRSFSSSSSSSSSSSRSPTPSTRSSDSSFDYRRRRSSNRRRRSSSGSSYSRRRRSSRR